MEPFKVEITFSAPMFIDSEYPIHLDALLAYAVVKEAEEYGEENPWEVGNDLSAILEKSDGEQWVWKASRLLFTPLSGLLFQNMIRRSDPDKFYQDVGVYWQGKVASDAKPLGIRPDTFNVKTDSGHQKGYQWLAASQWMKKAEAYCIGDIDALTHYLNQLTHIGKVGRNGFGTIKSITITKAGRTDTKKWKLRNLPLNEDDEGVAEFAHVSGCLHAPYWKKTNRVIVKEPII